MYPLFWLNYLLMFLVHQRDDLIYFGFLIDLGLWIFCQHVHIENKLTIVGLQFVSRKVQVSLSYHMCRKSYGRIFLAKTLNSLWYRCLEGIYSNFLYKYVEILNFLELLNDAT